MDHDQPRPCCCWTTITTPRWSWHPCYERACADEQREWRALLAAHQAQLREWAQNYPPTFHDKFALVSAEIARLEGRELDAERLYEDAIQSARENGFIQNEAIASELAAGFYLARGFAPAGNGYLEQARNCYARWGATARYGNSKNVIRNCANARGALPPRRSKAKPSWICCR